MNCPFCGADARTQRRFQCWTLSDLTERSGTCMERENESLKARVAELEAENKHLTQLLDGYRVHADAHRALLAKYDAEKNGWLDVVGKASYAIDLFAKLEEREKQRAEDEAWASERTVLVEFQPVTSGWYASAPDGVVGINATAPTIHGALRALRAKVEGGER